MVSAATLITLMNYCAPMTTLPQTVGGLGSGLTGQTWILNGIVLGLAALLLTVGSLADDYGRKRVFVIGAGLFALSGAVAALATGTLVFVLARVVQGGASAAMLATSLGIIGHTYPAGPRRAHATALWGAMLGLGIALGPIVSGALADAWSWRLGYGVFAVAAAGLIPFALLVLKESKAAESRALDPAGVGTLSVGLTALLAALTEGRLGWARPSVAVLLAVAVVSLTAFVVVERRGRAPMLDLGLLRQPLFVLATVGALITGLSVIGLMSYFPTVLQAAQGFGPLGSAATFGIWSGMAFLAALQSRRLRVSPRVQLAIGLALSAAGDLVLLGIAESWSWPRAVAGLLIAGIGSGLTNAALAGLAIASVPAGRASMGSGANQTARYIGASIGVAMMIAIVAATSGPDHNAATGLNTAIVVAALIALAGAAMALILRPAQQAA
ncbi:MFS transporter [Flindersiella endophytica]